MDPYIERPVIWPDFHDALVTAIRGILQPQLKPKYVALMQDRWFVVESNRPVWPDVAVIHSRPAIDDSAAGTALAEIDAPSSVFEILREEVKQPYLQIIEPAAGNRVITAIEVLSPDNKFTGPGRDAYLKKRDEYWGGANLVEIDLLRGGKPTVRLSNEQLDSLRPHRYLLSISRRWQLKNEVYALGIEQRLPRIPIPLAYDDPDVSLDLQAAFARCWGEGPYPNLLHYDGPPPSDLNPAEQAWCSECLRRAGYLKSS
jgi:hypothetical protein